MYVCATGQYWGSYSPPKWFLKAPLSWLSRVSYMRLDERSRLVVFIRAADVHTGETTIISK
jgi:hypothetical protein